MKILIPAIIALMLTACSIAPQKFDNREYEMIVRLQTATVELNTLCDSLTKQSVKIVVNALRKESNVIALYTRHTPRNKEVSESMASIAGDYAAFYNRVSTKGHNVAYCELNTDLIAKKAMLLIKVIPQKKR